MYLIDTNVLSEGRKGPRADPGVVDFIGPKDIPGDNLRCVRFFKIYFLFANFNRYISIHQ